MLAPVTEADFGEEGPLRVNLMARERWPAFATELEERTGLPTGYRESGAVVVAADCPMAGVAFPKKDLPTSTPSNVRLDRSLWAPIRSRASFP